MDQLTSARIDLVRRYLAHPAGWPDGIDTKYGRWYTGHEAHWNALARGDVVTKTPPHDVTKTTPVTKTTEEVFVTKKKGGRPKTGKALSGAERMRLRRAKKT